MKINMPVTDVKHELRDGQTIVSHTNLKGVITYANKEFVGISGYSKDELLGKPHNIVRHPDMPRRFCRFVEHHSKRQTMARHRQEPLQKRRSLLGERNRHTAY